ncbi:MAG: hypothetical protein WC805_03245 [Patescibacteria group bacterium]
MAHTQLKISKYTARDLVNKFGSPLYVYDQKVLEKQYKEIVDSFSYQPFQIRYAVMANNHSGILSILKGLGAGLQVNSPKELDEALAAGFKPNSITVTTTNISDNDLLLYAKKGLFINFDSKEEIERYCSLAKSIKSKNPEIGIRYQLRWSPPAHATNALKNKKRIGINRKDFPYILNLCKKSGLKVTSIHGYIASNMLSLAPFIRLSKELGGAAKLLPDLESINFGGGFGVKMKPTESEFDFICLGKHLSQLTEKLSNHFKREIILEIEPGRSLVGNAGTLLTTVTSIKHLDGWTQIGCDAGFGVFARPFVYGCNSGGYHPIVLADGKGGKHQKYTICSNSVLQSDFIGEDRKLPEIHIGDILAILNTGAYGAVMASGFPGKHLPGEVLL